MDFKGLINSFAIGSIAKKFNIPIETLNETIEEAKQMIDSGNIPPEIFSGEFGEKAKGIAKKAGFSDSTINKYEKQFREYQNSTSVNDKYPKL